MAVIATTQRLILRNFEMRDSDSFLRYRNDPKVAEYQSWTANLTPEIVRQFILEQRDLSITVKNIWIQIAVEKKDTGEHIGDCAYVVRDKKAEFGITIATQFQRQGFGAEILNALFDILFHQLNIHRIIAMVDVDNKSSIKLMLKMKMRAEGHFLKSFYDNKKEEWRDEYLFAILEEEFEPI